MELNTLFSTKKINQPTKNQDVQQEQKKAETYLKPCEEEEDFLFAEERRFNEAMEKRERDKRNALIASLFLLSSFVGMSLYDEAHEKNDSILGTKTEKTDKVRNINGETETEKTASFYPIFINTAKQNIISDITSENKLAKPKEKSYREKMEETINKYITGEELVRCLDFSKIEQYQKDITVLQGMLRINMPKIERNDSHRSEKFAKEVESAQKLIDRIADDYRMKGNVEGNENFDNILSMDEMLGILNTESLHDLPDNIKYKIISGAIKGYKPLYFRINDDKDVLKANKKILETVQPIQNELDRRALEEQKKHFINNSSVASI